jgi:type 2 lantibiotic, mersacidin/lichenicidin family
MSHLNIIRAWKDPEYREGLSEAERTMLPEHPAGLIELADAQLDTAAGGRRGGLSSIVVTRDTCTPSCPSHIYYPTCGILCNGG